MMKKPTFFAIFKSWYKLITNDYKQTNHWRFFSLLTGFEVSKTPLTSYLIEQNYFAKTITYREILNSDHFRPNGERVIYQLSISTVSTEENE